MQIQWESRYNDFCRLLIFFSKLNLKKSFRDTIRVSNGLDPDQDRHYVGPDLDPNCLQRLSADDKNAVEIRMQFINIFQNEPTGCLTKKLLKCT